MPKPPWKERKLQYLETLRTAPMNVVRVSLADKLHNARSLWMDWQRLGHELWTQFGGDRQQTLWFYESLVEVYQKRITGSFVSEFIRMVNALRDQTQQTDELSFDETLARESHSLYDER